MLLLASTNLPIQFGDESKPIKFDIQLNQHLGSIPVPGLEDSFPHVPPKKLVIFRDYVTCGGFLKLGVPWNHPFEKDIAKPSILGYVGGDFTRSWLSLPLWHSTKVKGGKKKKHFGVYPIYGNPHLSSFTIAATLTSPASSWNGLVGIPPPGVAPGRLLSMGLPWKSSVDWFSLGEFTGKPEKPHLFEEHPWFFRLGLSFKPMKISMEYSWNIGIWVEYNN